MSSTLPCLILLGEWIGERQKLHIKYHTPFTLCLNKVNDGKRIVD
ncbi:MAG: hypothetical protein WAW61_19390 [Methylococcaceae bacterium]